MIYAIKMKIIVSHHQQKMTFVGAGHKCRHSFVHFRRAADPYFSDILIVGQLPLHNFLTSFFDKLKPHLFLHLFSNSLVDLHCYFEPAALVEVDQLEKSQFMDVFDRVEGGYQVESVLLEEGLGEDGTGIGEPFPVFFVLFGIFLFEDEVDYIAKRQQTCPSGHNDHFSASHISQPQSQSFFTTEVQIHILFVNNSISQFFG